MCRFQGLVKFCIFCCTRLEHFPQWFTGLVLLKFFFFFKIFLALLKVLLVFFSRVFKQIQAGIVDAFPRRNYAEIGFGTPSIFFPLLRFVKYRNLCGHGPWVKMGSLNTKKQHRFLR